MKKILFLISVIPLLVSSQNYELWTSQDAPFYLRNPVSFVIGNIAYAGLGHGDWAPVQNKLFASFDPGSNSWSYPNTVAQYPGTANEKATAFSVNNFGYVIGGYFIQNSSLDVYSNQLWEYDAGNDAWTARANFPGAARAFAVSFVVGNKAYYGLGSNASTKFSDFYEYDPISDVWTQLASFPSTVPGAASAFAIGDKGYVVGGGYTGGTTMELWQYDTSTDSWVSKPSITSQYGPVRSGGVAFALNGRGYYGYGYSFPNGAISDLHEYNPLTETWNEVVNDPPPNSSSDKLCNGGTSFVIGTTAYFGMGTGYGGYTDNAMYKFWVTDLDEVGIKEKENTMGLSLFPNPTKGEVKIQSKTKIISYVISDITGKVVQSNELSQASLIDLKNLTYGVYFIKLLDDNQNSTVKKIVYTE